MHSILTQTLGATPAQATAKQDSVKAPTQTDDSKKADVSFDSVFEETSEAAPVPGKEAETPKAAQPTVDAVPVAEETSKEVLPAADAPASEPTPDADMVPIVMPKQHGQGNDLAQPNIPVERAKTALTNETTQVVKPEAERPAPQVQTKEGLQTKPLVSATNKAASPTPAHSSELAASAGLNAEASTVTSLKVPALQSPLSAKMGELSQAINATKPMAAEMPSHQPQPTTAKSVATNTLPTVPPVAGRLNVEMSAHLDQSQPPTQQSAAVSPRPEIAAQPTQVLATQVPSTHPQTKRHKLDATLQDRPTTLTATTVKPNLNASTQMQMAQPNVQTPVTETSKASPALDVEPVTGLRTEASSSTATQQAQTLPTRAELPQHMARQVAEALQNMPNRPVEIRLNPEELGRVRLGVTSVEGNIMVTILAERPETGDLMRRHINALETAFQELGYSDINFSFAGGGNSAQAENDNGRESNDFGNSQNSTIAPDETPVLLHLNAAPVTGVDIRL